MDKTQTLGEVLSLLRRRVLLWSSTVALGLLISLAYALSLPPEYQTSATIQIEQPPIQTGDGSRGSLNADMLQKLQIVEQRVMARDNLLAIIDKFSLYSDASSLSDVQKVDLLRRAANVTHITNPEFRWRQDISPSALLVTVRMSDPNLVADVANELVTNVLDQEQRRRSDRVRETLEFFDSEEERIEGAINALEEEIANYRLANDVLLPGGIEALRERLSDLQQVELEVEREILTLQGGSTDNSIRGQRLRRLEEERSIYLTKMADIRKDIAETPRLEKHLSALERELGKLEDQYQAITSGKAEAEMEQMLEASRQSNSFAVLEQAIAPKWPIAPSRKKIMAMGGLLSAMAALTLLFLAEMRNPVLRTLNQFERQLHQRAVAVIPTIESPRQRRRRSFGTLARLGSVVGVFIALSAIILKFGR